MIACRQFILYKIWRNYVLLTKAFHQNTNYKNTRKLQVNILKPMKILNSENLQKKTPIKNKYPVYAEEQTDHNK